MSDAGQYLARVMVPSEDIGQGPLITFAVAEKLVSSHSCLEMSMWQVLSGNEHVAGAYSDKTKVETFALFDTPSHTCYTCCTHSYASFTFLTVLV